MEHMDKRTDYCGNITAKYEGQEVTLFGWVQRVRNLVTWYLLIYVTVKVSCKLLLTKILVRN